jgi:hypothetical protein
MPEATVHHVHPLGVGDVVPDFTLPDQNGTQRTLSEAVAERPVLLVFYPFAFSGICTGELSEIRDDLGAFDNDGVQVWAISCDPTPSLLAWADKEGYFFPLALGLLAARSGRTPAYGDLATRSTVLPRARHLLGRPAPGSSAGALVNGPGERRDFDAYRRVMAQWPTPAWTA